MAAPKTVSFTNPGIQGPDFGQMQQLGAEQQMLMEALQRESGAVSAPVINTGKFAALNFDGIGNSIVANRNKDALEINRKKLLDLQGKHSEELVKQLRKLNAADPNDPEAISEAEMSPYEQVRNRGDSLRKALLKREEQMNPRASLESIKQGRGDLRNYAAKPEVGKLGETLYNSTEGAAPKLLPGQGFAQVPDPNNPAQILNQNRFTGEMNPIDRAPKMTVTNAGPKLLDETIKELVGAKAKTITLGNTLRSTEQALNALETGARAGGSGAELEQNIRGLVTRMTGVSFDANTPTAVLIKSLAENVVNEFGGKLGAGVSNADVAFMEKAMTGVQTDPKAIERVLAIRAAAAIRAIDSHNSVVDTIGSTPGNSIGEETTRKLYRVERPNFAFKFPSLEAQASFESGIGNIPFETALNNIRKESAKEAGNSNKAPGGETREQSLERLRKKYGGG